MSGRNLTGEDRFLVVRHLGIMLRQDDSDGHLWEIAHNPLFWLGPRDE